MVSVVALLLALCCMRSGSMGLPSQGSVGASHTAQVAAAQDNGNQGQVKARDLRVRVTERHRRAANARIGPKLVAKELALSHPPALSTGVTPTNRARIAVNKCKMFQVGQCTQNPCPMGHLHAEAETDIEKQRLAQLREQGPPRPNRSASPSSDSSTSGDGNTQGRRPCYGWINNGVCPHGPGCTFRRDMDKRRTGKGKGKPKGKAKAQARSNGSSSSRS